MSKFLEMKVTVKSDANEIPSAINSSMAMRDDS